MGSFSITSTGTRIPFSGAPKKVAIRTAPSAFRRPAPCARNDASSRASSVYCKMALTAFGVRFGSASSINATVPVTTGAAMLVPVRLRYGMYAVIAVPSSR